MLWEIDSHSVDASTEAFNREKGSWGIQRVVDMFRYKGLIGQEK